MKGFVFGELGESWGYISQEVQEGSIFWDWILAKSPMMRLRLSKVDFVVKQWGPWHRLKGLLPPTVFSRNVPVLNYRILGLGNKGPLGFRAIFSQKPWRFGEISPYVFYRIGRLGGHDSRGLFKWRIRLFEVPWAMPWCLWGSATISGVIAGRRSISVLNPEAVAFNNDDLALMNDL